MSSVRRRAPYVLPAALLGLVLTAVGCVSTDDALTTGTTPNAADERQPRMATYRCGEGGELTVENRGSSVTVASGDESVELPAAPSDQASRYSESVYALLLEGREAVWFAGRKPPVTCTR